MASDLGRLDSPEILDREVREAAALYSRHYPYTREDIDKVVVPLAKYIIEGRRRDMTEVDGFHGGQGAGKTTLSEYCRDIAQEIGFTALAVSIDDFYETRDFRLELSKKMEGNPFYQISRGMPGTHRLDYLKEVLREAKAGRKFYVPRFDKSLFDGYGDVLCDLPVGERLDFFFLDGWNVGMPSAGLSELAEACRKNGVDLEKIDPGARHCGKVLEYAKMYEPVWSELDRLVELRPDSIELHQKWRWDQEEKLIKKAGSGMTREQVRGFVDMYQPFVALCRERMEPDVRINIDPDHRLTGMEFAGKKSKS